MKYQVQVTQKHIEKGARNNSGKCPIALALRSIGATRVGVGGALCRFRIEGAKHELVRLPKKARDFVENFDDGNPVRPFRFTINVPEAE